MSIERQCTSKYFTNKGTGDESLSDFQEAKKSFKGPKSTKYPNKINPKKKSKQIKGQKDIRTALEEKKGELVLYAKEFGDVCKKSGLDVDPEELQLAIALSKSLQTDNCIEINPTKSLSSQERRGKIRTTLQEYGFKVPEIKTTSNKRVRKLKKDYKLLQLSEEERSQLISDKYSKRLFQNFDSYKLVSDSNTAKDSDAPVYNLATNLSYGCMRDNSVFYVNDLVEKSTTTFSLLRDWSEIPGRPVSPTVFEIDTMNFDIIRCTQNELDVIMSGSLQVAKDVINKKVTGDIMTIDKLVEIHEKADPKGNNKAAMILLSENKRNLDKIEQKQDFDAKELSTTEQYRSCSPDLFDDEVSSIMENPRNNDVLSQEYKSKVFSQGNNSMDLTECVNILTQNLIPKPNSQLSQDITKRKSNDFMEITNCVAISQKVIKNLEEEIDLTLSSGDYPCEVYYNTQVEARNIDLTQPLNNDIDLTGRPKTKTVLVKEINIVKPPKQHFDLTHFCNERSMNIISNESSNNEVIESMDLTQSSNSTDELPFVQVDNKSLDETIILNENEYLGINGNVKQSIVPIYEGKDQILDLTQQGTDDSFIILSDPKNTENDHCNMGSQSFFEEFVHEHSDSTVADQSYNENLEKFNTNNEGDIDLTQDSDSSKDGFKTSSTLNILSHKISNNSSLGKKDDVSIDYDEICIDRDGDECPNTESIRNIYRAKNEDKIPEIMDQKKDLVSNSSQNSEAFAISDNEFDYSIHQSRQEIPIGNFEFGGISIMDDITRPSGSFDDEKNGTHKHVIEADSFLPERVIKRSSVQLNDVPNLNSNNISPSKNDLAAVLIQTPSNREYFIKRNEVTPILDYASMTTPQRNKELDKYGLKPLKRKRAIQILTHLYNQTHPLVQPLTSDDQPSPSKRPRKAEDPKHVEAPESDYSNIRPKLNELSPKRTSKNRLGSIESRGEKVSPRGKCGKRSPGVNNICSKENHVYELTSESLDLRTVECDPDDWVFQKREKAKVYSCRVPLHIAFHNYVSSRRGLREAILKYEPVNIDVIHKDLAAYGHRYDPKDLLKFLDKKCITVKTVDNNSRNNKR